MGYGIPYFDELTQEGQDEVRQSVRLLLRQTFLLEHKYDRRTGRFQYNREFRACSKHLEFIKNYFAISGIMVQENSQIGVIYIQGETLVGDKLPRLATLYLLALKLIYDEQMESVSTSVNVYTSLREIHEKLGAYRLLKKQPSPTEIRRAVSLLKKYQVIECLDLMEDLGSGSRMIIYPCIHMVLMGDDARALLSSFEEGQDPGEAAGSLLQAEKDSGGSEMEEETGLSEAEEEDPGDEWTEASQENKSANHGKGVTPDGD